MAKCFSNELTPMAMLEFLSWNNAKLPFQNIATKTKLRNSAKRLATNCMTPACIREMMRLLVTTPTCIAHA